MRKQLAMLLGVVTCGAAAHAAETVGPQTSRTAPADTVYVAAPTGDETTDRPSILAALAQAGPGDVIRFAPGTYIVGEIIPIDTAQLTILGNGVGTTLRGCNPDAYERMERETEAAGEDQEARMAARLTCGMFEMTGGHGTVRGLTFEYTWIGLALGAGHSSERRVTEGGYLVEDNVFRNSANGVRPGEPYDDDVPAFDLGAWTAYPYFESGIIAVSSGSEGLFLLRYSPERPVWE